MRQGEYKYFVAQFQKFTDSLTELGESQKEQAEAIRNIALGIYGDKHNKMEGIFDKLSHLLDKIISLESDLASSNKRIAKLELVKWKVIFFSAGAIFVTNLAWYFFLKYGWILQQVQQVSK